MLFPTTIAGSLPKPEWLAEPNTLWAPWKSKGEELARAKRDATLLAVKLQEDAGIDIVTEGEQARQHFVHGFMEKIEGIDFAHKVEMGIRKDRYKAMVPQVVAPLRLKGRVHADEARVARGHTARKLKFTLPGPMTIIDTVDLFQKAVDEMLAGLLALGDDIDPGILLQLHGQHGGVALGAGEFIALGFPGRPQRIGLGQPFRLRQRTGDRGWKQHGSLPEGYRLRLCAMFAGRPTRPC